MYVTFKFKVMPHIKSLFKTVVLFYLSAVLCSGCWLFSKEKLIPRAPSRALQDAGQAAVQSAEAAGQNPQESNDKELLKKQEMVETCLRQFTSYTAPALCQPTAPTASQHPNQAALQKDMASLLDQAREQNMAQWKEILSQSGLSDPQIEALITLYKDVSCKLQEKFLKLPCEQLQALCDVIKSKQKLQKEIAQTVKQLEGLLSTKPVESLEEATQIKVQNNVSQAVFQQLIELFQENCKISQGYIHPMDHGNLQACQRIADCGICVCEGMQAALLRCSPKEQEAYQTHLACWLDLLKRTIEEEKKMRQIMPNPLIGGDTTAPTRSRSAGGLHSRGDVCAYHRKKRKEIKPSV